MQLGDTHAFAYSIQVVCYYQDVETSRSYTHPPAASSISIAL